MKRIFSFLLAVLLLVSAVPMAQATNDYTAGTKVEYTAANNEAYTITVPAQLAPGGSGTVTLSGTWADNRVVTVTADPTVTLTNSIKAEDQKVLNVNFDGISEAGSNTEKQTFTQGISVDGITDALFGTWSGKFNYNVSTADYINLNPDDGSTPANGDVYTAGDYKYTYRESYDGWYVRINTEVTDENQTTYGAILESINGKPVKSMSSTFDSCINMTIAPKIPDSVTNMQSTFGDCQSLTTVPEIPAGVTNMSQTFNGCIKLTTAPKIPAGVTNMSQTFNGCTNLASGISIPCSLASENYSYINCPATITYYHIDGCDGSCGQ